MTKTKPSHHRQSNGQAQVGSQPAGPTTFQGQQLIAEMQASALVPEMVAKLTREIVEHEASHGTCTQTFIKKMRKRLRVGA